VNAAPATPAAPTLNVTQPTCAVATGTITITSPTAGLTFSVNGGAYAAYPAGGYTGLAAGPYTITAQNAAGCISADANATVNAAPAAPNSDCINPQSLQPVVMHIDSVTLGAVTGRVARLCLSCRWIRI
jgi:hypothetical protein